MHRLLLALISSLGAGLNELHIFDLAADWHVVDEFALAPRSAPRIRTAGCLEVQIPLPPNRALPFEVHASDDIRLKFEP